MKKLLIFAMVFLMAASAVLGARVLEFERHEMQCLMDGACRFNFFYTSGEGNIDLDEVNVLADGEEVKGDWVDNDEDVIHELRQGKRANFVSDIGAFYKEAVYDMSIEYPDEDGSTKYINFEISSPGYTFSCSKFEMVLERCYTLNGNFYMEITADGFGSKWKEDLTEKVDYYLPGNRQRHEGNLEGMNAEMSKTASGYVIMVPLGYAVSTGYLKGAPYGCDKTEQYSDTISWKKCEQAPDETTTISTPHTGISQPANDGPEADAPADDSGNNEPAAEPTAKKKSVIGRFFGWLANLFG